MNQQVAVSAQARAEETEAECVLRVLVALGDELGGSTPPRGAGPANRPQDWPPISMPDEASEELLAGFRTELERLADSFRREPREEELAVTAALDGAQLAIRGEIVTGRPEALRGLLPSLVYLVALPVAGEAQALRVAERVAKASG